MKKIVKITWLLWLLLGVAGFIIGLAGLATADSSPDAICAGVFALWGLVGTVGTAMLIRGYWLGAILWVVLTGVNTALLLTFGADYGYWMSSLAIPVCIIGCVPALTLFLPSGAGGPVIRNMDAGFGWRRSRHVYQLSFLLTIGVTVWTLLQALPYSASVKVDKNEQKEATTDEGEPTASTSGIINAENVMAMADAPDATLSSLNKASRRLHLLSDSLNVVYSDRVAALSDLLRRGVTPPHHDARQLANVMMYHSGAVSPAQQEIIDWYLVLTDSNRRLWEECGPVNSLAELKTVLERHINAPTSTDSVPTQN